MAISAKHVKLTEAEAELAKRIEFNPASRTHDAAAAHASGEGAWLLMKSLVKRDAIPKTRLRWFTDPDCNIGGRGVSRRDMFQRKGLSDKDMVQHPSFIRLYLRYFVFGPDLPVPVIERFESAIADCGTVTSGDIEPLRKLARQLVRVHGLNAKNAAEEIFKLGLECGLHASEARFIRDAVKPVR